MEKNNYSYLSGEVERMQDGYIIVENTLFEVSNFNITDSWQLDGDTVKAKVESAREVAELSENVEIIYDDIGTYSEDILHDEGRLCTAFDRPLTDDEEDLIDFFSKD